MAEPRDYFKELVWDNLVNVAMASLFTAVPWLNIPGLRQLVEMIVRFITNRLYEVTKLTVDLRLIVFNNADHQKAYATAALTLKGLAETKGVNSPEFRKARDEHKKTLSAFASFNIGIV